MASIPITFCGQFIPINPYCSVPVTQYYPGQKKRPLKHILYPREAVGLSFERCSITPASDHGLLSSVNWPPLFALQHYSGAIIIIIMIQCTAYEGSNEDKAFNNNIQKQFKIYTCKYKCTPTKYKCTQIHMVARKKGKLSSSPTPLLPIGFSDSPLLLSHLRLSPKLVKTAPEKDPRKISHSDIPPTELSNNFHLLKCLQNFSANLDLQVYLI